MTDKDKIRNIIELFIAWNGETEVIDVANIDSAVDFIFDSMQEKPVSTRDKLRALSDGKQHLGWLDDAREVEEEPVSIWHDASEVPEDKNWVLLTHRDGWFHVGRLYEGQHGNLVISDGVSAFKLCEFKRWAYIDDLLKL